MSVNLTAKSAIRSLRDKTIEVAAQCTGNYVNSGTTGDVVNLFLIVASLGQEAVTFGYPCKIANGEVIGNVPGYKAELVAPVANSATPNLWGLRIFQTGAALSGPFAELGNGAYPAALLAAPFTLRFRGPHGSC